MIELSKEQTLPVFPLTGQLMLPGTFLPLNVFESRYRNMVEDVLEGDRKIGMVQPLIPGLDNFGVPPLDLDDPELYAVGCCGIVDRHERQEDGRHLIVLEGLVRFRILHELEPRSGYRRVQADFSEFELDRSPVEPAVDRLAILAILDRFADRRDLEFDRDLLDALAPSRLINTLSAALPFTAVEKQALLEARTTEDRAALLTTLMGIEIDSDSPADRYSPPTIH